MSPLVELVEVSKGYGGVQALDDVSFAIEPGAVHALVGENGAGKSTLMKIMRASSSPTRRATRRGRAQTIGSPQARTGSGSSRCTRS